MDAVRYLRELIAFPSVSRESNAAVSDHIAGCLRALKFDVERIEYRDAHGVVKVSVVGKLGSGTGGLAYFAHSDVVPADNWYDSNGPFVAVEKDQRIYGRGSCDMKGSLACMLAAVQGLGTFTPKAPLYVTVTADEEIGFAGAKAVVDRSYFYREMVAGNTPGIIGEPTELEVVYAHKGVVGLHATARGRAAHSSTRHGVNANLAMIPFLSDLKQVYDETETDPAWSNPEFDPPTITMNIGINDHTPAVNITPPQSRCTMYFRPMPGTDVDGLIARIGKLAERHDLEFEVPIRGVPVYTPADSKFVREIVELAGVAQARTVAYGTDGTEFHELKQLVVYGPGSIAQAHTKDEWISLEQLQRGTSSYRKLVEHFCNLK